MNYSTHPRAGGGRRDVAVDEGDFLERERLLSLAKQFGQGDYARYLEMVAHQPP